MYNFYKNEYVDFLLRASPIFIYLYIILEYLLSYDKQNLFLFVGLFFGNILNKFFKDFIFKPLIGDDKLPIVGKGTRPKGAKDCGLFKNDKLNNEYGMPSGHSQNIATFSTFLFYKNESNYQPRFTKNIFNFILFGITFLIMYSRIIYKCHTVQQVILGGIIGFVFGNVLWNNRHYSYLF